MWELHHKEGRVLNCCFQIVVLEKTLESPLNSKEIKPGQSYRRSTLNSHWKDWGWSWSSNILATSWEELTHWKRPWCWERLRAGKQVGNRGWNGWMAWLTWWTWVWASSRRWWQMGKPGVVQFMGSQRLGHDSPTELNWNIWMASQIQWTWFWANSRS